MPEAFRRLHMVRLSSSAGDPRDGSICRDASNISGVASSRCKVSISSDSGWAYLHSAAIFEAVLRDVSL